MGQGTHEGREDLSPSRAALIAGLALLATTLLAPAAFFGIFPKLIVRSDPALTVQNIQAHQGLFLLGIGFYFATFLADIAIAWALGAFLRPAGPRLSQLAAWLRVVFATLSLSALFKLPVVLRLVRTPDFAAHFGPAQLQAQVQVLLTSFRVAWSLSMIVFSLHLALLSVLCLRSGFVPKVIGVLLAVNGLAYFVDTLHPYLFPQVPLPYLVVGFFGEIVLMVWLLVRGSRMGPEPSADPS